MPIGMFRNVMSIGPTGDAPIDPTVWEEIVNPFSVSTSPTMHPFNDGYMAVEQFKLNGEPDNVAKFSADGVTWGADILIPNIGRDALGRTAVVATQKQGNIINFGARGGRNYRYNNTTKLFETFVINDPTSDPLSARSLSITLASGVMVTSGESGGTYYVVRSTDGGANWTATQSTGSASVHTAVQMTSGRVIIIAYDGRAYYSDDDCASITQLPRWLNSGATSGPAVSIQLLGGRVLASFDGGFISYSDDGTTWITGLAGANCGVIASSTYGVIGELNFFMFATANGYCSYSYDAEVWITLPRWLVSGDAPVAMAIRGISGGSGGEVVVSWAGYAAKLVN